MIGLRDVITFQGESVSEVTQAFHDSVDDYLEFFAARSVRAPKTYSGQFVLRIDPQVHRELAELAERRSVSLNALIDSAIKNALGSDIRERSGLHTDGELASPLVRTPRSGRRRGLYRDGSLAPRSGPRRCGKRLAEKRATPEAVRKSRGQTERRTRRLRQDAVIHAKRRRPGRSRAGSELDRCCPSRRLDRTGFVAARWLLAPGGGRARGTRHDPTL